MGLREELAAVISAGAVAATPASGAAEEARPPEIEQVRPSDQGDVYDEIVDLFGQLGYEINRTGAKAWLREKQNPRTDTQDRSFDDPLEDFGKR